MDSASRSLHALLVEDDDIKSRHLADHFREQYPQFSLRIVRSVNEATRSLSVESFAVVLLDMSLPTFSIKPNYETGGRPQGFGGQEVLRFMRRKRLAIPTIVITQFEQFGSGADSIDLDGLEDRLKKESDSFVTLIYYHPTTIRWTVELKRALTFALGAEVTNE